MEKHYSVTQPIYSHQFYKSPSSVKPYQDSSPQKVYTSPSNFKPFNGTPEKIYSKSNSNIQCYQDSTGPEKVYPTNNNPYGGSPEKICRSNSNIRAYQDSNGPEKVYHSPSGVSPYASSPEKVCRSDSDHQNSNGHPEQIYSDPDVLTKNRNNEKDAVRYIMEKYDSLRCLNGQLDSVHISSDSGDSIQKVPIDDDDQEPVDTNEVTETDIAQVEVFFRSHKTHVSVCQCLANLYFATCSDTSGDEKAWELARTGIPVLLLDKGETRARDKRMLQIVLAEKGSGFVLWRDVIDNLSNYRAAEEGKTFHTMYLSSDHRKMAGLSFDNPEAAARFLEEIELLTSDPLNICLSVPKQKKKPKAPKKKEKVKQPRKCDISTPCCFQHVTNVALNDKKKLFSMATLVSRGGRVTS